MNPVFTTPYHDLHIAAGLSRKIDCEVCKWDGFPPHAPKKVIYIIGSLRNPAITPFANDLEAQGYEVFADWAAAGPDADDCWRDYSKARGWDYKRALQSHAAKTIFELDKKHLDRCDAAVMVMPAGKSGHLELGYIRGKGKPGFILFDEEPERFDVMVQFATDIFFKKEELFEALKSILQ